MDPCAPGQGDLGGEVGRAAEAVDAEPPALGEVGAQQRPVADDARAQQRRGLDVVERVGQRVGVVLVDHGVLGVAAVEVPAGEARVDAEVLAPDRQKRQMPQVWASQGTPMRSPSRQRVRSGPSLVDDAHDLVPGRDLAVRRGGRSPSARCRSVRQTPQARTRSRTWPGPGSGTSFSTRARGPVSTGPGSSTTHAFMRAAMACSVGRSPPRRPGPFRGEAPHGRPYHGPVMTTLVLPGPVGLTGHDDGPRHPEQPARLQAVMDGVAALDLGDDVVHPPMREATVEELARVHSRTYLNELQAFCEQGGGNVDPDTYAAGDLMDARARPRGQVSRRWQNSSAAGKVLPSSLCAHRVITPRPREPWDSAW